MSTSYILLIEDDPAVAQALQDGLTREGYKVVWKSEGEAGVSFAQKNTVHLILLDVRLPDGSGFDFCRQARQKGLHMPISAFPGNGLGLAIVKAIVEVHGGTVDAYSEGRDKGSVFTITLPL